MAVAVQAKFTPEPTLAMIMTKLEKLDIIESRLSKLDEIEESLKEIKSTSEAFKQKTTDDIDNMTIMLADNNKRLNETTRNQLLFDYRIGQLEQQNSKLKYQVNELENKTKQCNIKIDGKYEEQAEELKNYVWDLIKYLIPTSMDPAVISMVYRIGKQHPPQLRSGQKHPRPRTILVVIRSIHERNAIFYAKTKLRESTNYKMIYINDDVSLQTRKLRDDYRSVAALAHSSGSTVKVHGDGIVVDGKKYRHGDPEYLPHNLTLAKAKMIKMRDGIYFSSEHVFLSNFYLAPIIHEGIVYPTAEHRLQALKCEYAGDHRKLELVRNAVSPLEAKRWGDQVAESAEWRKDREDTLKAILDLKFDQHPKLATMLVNTESCKLYEATVNEFYGIGAQLHSRELRDKSYSGLNKLGIALENKRASINKSIQTPSNP